MEDDLTDIDGWNYRLIRHEENDRESYAIHEVYYDSSGTPLFCGKKPATLVGDSITNLASEAEYFCRAFQKEPLDYENFDSF